MKKRGATLLESMLVMLIVVVLAIVFSAVYAGDPPRLDGKCLGNLKQSGVALEIYLADSDDRFPGRDGWMDVLKPYAKTDDVYHCPEIQPQRPDYYGYAFNSWLDQRKAVKNLAEVPLFYDSINLARNASDPFASFPEATGSKELFRRAVSFADTHVAIEPAGWKGWEP